MPAPTFRRGEIVKVKHAGYFRFFKKIQGNEWADIRTLDVYKASEIKHELEKAEKASPTTVAAFINTNHMDAILRPNGHTSGSSGVASQQELAKVRSDYQLNGLNILNKDFTTKDLKNTWILDTETSYATSANPVATAGIYNPNGRSIPGFNSNKVETFFLDSLSDTITGTNIRANTSIDTVGGSTVKHISKNLINLVNHELKRTPTAVSEATGQRLREFVAETSTLLNSKNDKTVVGSLKYKLKHYKDDLNELVEKSGVDSTLVGQADEDDRIFAVTGKSTHDFVEDLVDKQLEGQAPGTKVNLHNFNVAFDIRKLRIKDLLLGDKVSKSEMKGEFSVMFDSMFRESGLSNTNTFGTTFGSLAKKLNLTDRQSEMIFNRMATGWDDKYSRGFSLANTGSLVDYVLGYGKRVQIHEALDDTVQAELTFNRMHELSQILMDEQNNIPGGAHTKYREMGLNMKYRTMYGMFRQAAADTLSGWDLGLERYGKNEEKLDAVDSIMRKDGNYRAMVNKIESSAGHAINHSLFGSVAEAVGEHTVNNLLAGAALLGGVNYVMDKARTWAEEREEDKNRIDGMPHTSFLTMARRISMTDFRSAHAGGGISSAGDHPIEDTGDLFTSVTRTIKHLFHNAQDVIMERAGRSSSPTMSFIHKALKAHNSSYGIKGEVMREASSLGRDIFYEATKTMLRTKFGRDNFNITEDFIDKDLKWVAKRDGVGAVIHELAKKTIKKDITKSAFSHFASLGIKKVTSIFMKENGKLTGTGAFTAAGFGLGLAINILKGRSDKSYDYSKYYNNDKVRNDPRFEDRKHGRRLISLADQVRSAKEMDGISVQSPQRERNRFAMTDFGSGLGSRFMGKMLGEVKGMKLLRFMDDQLITRIPEVQKEQLTRTTKSVVTKLKEDLKVLINKPSLNKATKVAEREVESFAGAEDATRSIVDKVEKSAEEGARGSGMQVTSNRSYKQLLPEGTSAANSEVIKSSRTTGISEAASDVALQETRNTVSNNNANDTLVGRMKDIVTPSHKQHLPDKAILDITDPQRKPTNIPRTSKMRAMKYAPILEARTGENAPVVREALYNKSEINTARKVANAPTTPVKKPDVRVIKEPTTNGRVNNKVITRTNPKPVYNLGKPRAIEPNLEKYDIRGATRNKERLSFTYNRANNPTYGELTHGENAGYATANAVKPPKYETPYYNNTQRGVRYSHEKYNKNIIVKSNGPNIAERQLSDWMTDPRSSIPAHRYAYHTTGDFNRLPAYAH